MRTYKEKENAISMSLLAWRLEPSPSNPLIVLDLIGEYFTDLYEKSKGRVR